MHLRVLPFIAATIASLTLAASACAGGGWGTGSDASCMATMYGANACATVYYDYTSGAYRVQFAAYTGKEKYGYPEFVPAPTGSLTIRPSVSGLAVVLKPGLPGGRNLDSARILSVQMTLGYGDGSQTRNIRFAYPMKQLRFRGWAFSMYDPLTDRTINPNVVQSGSFQIYDPTVPYVIRNATGGQMAAAAG